ncbi:hypothetical protein AA106556_1906 [Neokomagataea tanensis NBRC 106556]|uniref:Uncharacterized protein n=1 Tax=Neokomagataea tanensis NBRC 106556 TaxID=1223519 RepID=A0ABQ0QL54_9PROT|nr:hypothetical protein AA106556_1906 [Neokomagataea tanensis NBRC 106556]
MQLEVESIDHAETLTIRIETPTDVDPLVVTDFLTGHYHGLSDRHEFDRALETFSFCVECYPEGGLSRDPVSGKVRPVIDRRLAGIENLNMAGQDEDSLRPDAPTRDFPTLTTRV